VVGKSKKTGPFVVPGRGIDDYYKMEFDWVFEDVECIQQCQANGNITVKLPALK
jgi:hypothetical protein